MVLKVLLFILFQIVCTAIDCCDSREMPDYWKELSKNELKGTLQYQANLRKAKNIILCIGDGMSLSTVTAMRIYKNELEGRPGNMDSLFFENFPNTGLLKVYTTTYMTAGSAATATAYMTGARTKSGHINVDNSNQEFNCTTYNEQTNLKSIPELAKESGKSVGIVTTSRITHATPATTYAHTVYRWWEADSDIDDPKDKLKCPDIARQFIEKGNHIDVMMGGGRRNFMPLNQTDPEYPERKGLREDNRDLIDEWRRNRILQKSQNCDFIYDQQGFDKVNPYMTDCLLGLFEYNDMKFEYERKNDTLGEPSLTEMTEKAIKILSRNSNGFFLLIEGGRIDHGHHQNRAKVAITEGLEFEKAIKKAIEKTDNDETLVIVTADHSHGMSIAGYLRRGEPLFGLSDSTGDNGIPYTTLLYTRGPGHRSNLLDKDDSLYKGDTESFDYRQQATIPHVRSAHGGDDVPVYARGPFSHLIRRLTEQTYINEVMKFAGCLGEHSQANHCIENSSAPTMPHLLNVLCQLVLVYFLLRLHN